jgi:hypothetical protein
MLLVSFRGDAELHHDLPGESLPAGRRGRRGCGRRGPGADDLDEEQGQRVHAVVFGEAVTVLPSCSDTVEP